ncbi:hypothetical protein CNYM01_02995 [Colletotrichum nymphaeae SA-01]|uniref:Uncharacterized protein n=1 Tax=Colletotrichum nymphaeae SA-01 TaxID=1460502 RepID=A0A135U3W4_9PEZI|nr:hypothetical protein CNYM01_02995 [Colletotrichum nymphaeae SA-01]
MHRVIATCKCKSVYVKGATYFFFSIPQSTKDWQSALGSASKRPPNATEEGPEVHHRGSRYSAHVAPCLFRARAGRKAGSTLHLHSFPLRPARHVIIRHPVSLRQEAGRIRFAPTIPTPPTSPLLSIGEEVREKEEIVDC